MVKVLIVSPHIDDETLGAGGTLLSYKKRGAELYWLNFANAKVEYGYEREYLSRRLEQIDNVKQQYGITKMWDLALKPAALKDYEEYYLIEKVSAIVKEIAPNILILPYENDIHSDHSAVFRTMLPFTKSFRNPSIKTVLTMEIISETEFALPNKSFSPNYYVDISDFIEKKIDIMRLYSDELGEHPFPRNIENIKALAHFRGATVGVKYAEAFMLIKHIKK